MSSFIAQYSISDEHCQQNLQDVVDVVEVDGALGFLICLSHVGDLVE